MSVHTNPTGCSCSAKVPPIEAPPDVVDRVLAADDPLWGVWAYRNGNGYKLPGFVLAGSEEDATHQAERLVGRVLDAAGVPYERKNVDEIRVRRIIE